MQRTEMISEKFDVIVIGSSPILMLYALKSRKEGKSVMLIEKSNTLGGAWSIDSHTIGLKNIKHENACHLIEWYAGGYELIERISGIRFLPLVSQPIKVWQSGRRDFYTSRMSIFTECLLSFRSIIYAIIKLGISYFGIGKSKTEVCWNNVGNAIERMIVVLRYRLLSIAEFNGIRSPEGGDTHFINYISEQLGSQGVEVFNGNADKLVLKSDGSGYIEIGEKRLNATSIVVGESSIFEKNNQNNLRMMNYYHVLIATRASDTISRNPYIHYPDHPVFHRITYVEDSIDADGIEIAVFLIQIRIPLDDILSLQNAFVQVQNLYPIVKSEKYFKILKSINSQHFASSVDSAWYTYDGKAPLVLKTIGDLSRNMILMQHKFLNEK